MKSQVLIVDDDDDLREIVCAVLADADYDVRGAASGLEALSTLRGANRPNIILLDLMMPVMTGFELRERLLEEPDLACIPVVVMTASRGFDVGPLAAAAVVYKPLDVTALVEAVERGLASRRPTRPGS
jgi:CheY-like chemotaxis protein